MNRINNNQSSLIDNSITSRDNFLNILKDMDIRSSGFKIYII